MGGNKYRFDAPVLERLAPGAFELIGVSELVKELWSVEIGAAVDKNGGGRVKLPDQIPTPVVVVEDSADGWVQLEKGDCAGGEVLRLSLWLVLDYLGDVDSGKDHHRQQDCAVDQGPDCDLRTLCA